MKNEIKLTHILVINLFASFSCMIYELVLAQILSATIGNTMLRYGTTIGLYLASMGAGSLFLSKFRTHESLAKKLFNVEMTLSWLGLISPFFMILADRFTRADSLNIPYLNFIIGYIFVIIIGLVTGAELPILMALAEKTKKTANILVLVFDYLGTLLASLIFPLYLLPTIGVVYTSFLASLINTLVSLFIMWRYKVKSLRGTIFLFLICAILMILIFNFNNYEQWLIYEVYLK